MTEKSSVGAATSAPQTWPIEPFEVPPHPCNLQLLDALSTHLLETLSERMLNARAQEEFPWAPHFIKAFHNQEADGVPSLLATRSLLQFALDQHQRIGAEPRRSDVSADQRYNAVLEIPCAVTRNLGWLRSSLHLSDVESKLLLWTYAVSHRRSEVLREAFAVIQFGTPSTAYSAMATLLDESVDAVSKCFAAPNRLLAMRLLWNGRRTVPVGLDEFFDAGDLLPAVLETVHRSQQAMLDRLLEPEPSWTLDPKVETPCVQFYDWFEKPVADAFAATVRNEPLTDEHIVALVEWLTGFRLEHSQCAPLAGHLTLQAIEQALKQSFVFNAGCERAMTPLMVLSTLYVMAA